jgi:outer membrane protein TolC
MSGALILACAVTFGPVAPVYGQGAQSGQAGQASTSQGQATAGQNPAPAQTPAPGPPPPPPGPKSVSDKVPGEHDYEFGKRWFPRIWDPYTPMHVPMPNLSNTPKLDQLIKDGKLYVSVQDAIALALENNMDIAVQRYNPWIAETAIMRDRAASANPLGPNFSYDPSYTLSASIQNSSTPIANPLLSGTGTGVTGTGLLSLASHTAQINNTYAQGFDTGTSFQIFQDNTKLSQSPTASAFNPYIESTLGIGVTQYLLRGFGREVNDRYILIAKNSKVVSDYAFKYSVLTDITTVENDYWEVVFARRNVDVAQSTVTYAQRLLRDNKKQLEIGTMSPLDVTNAEANAASANTLLIQDQTILLQDEATLLSVITKNPIAPNLLGVEIIPTDNTFIPEETESAPLDQLAKEALANRPDYQELLIGLKSDQINIHGANNELLPLLSISGQVSWTGLAGNLSVPGATVPNTYAADLAEPIVNANGVPVPGQFISIPVNLASTTTSTGLTNALDALVTNQFPTYGAQVNLTLPIRNRAAQADAALAVLTQRQDLTRLQQTQNTIIIGIRNAQIALEQARASLTAAQAAYVLAQQSEAAEEKKLQFGTSSSELVVQQQELLAAAAGTDVRDEVNLVEAKVNFDAAMARTFTVNNVDVISAKNITSGSGTKIPGTTASGELYGLPDLNQIPPAKPSSAPPSGSNASATPVQQNHN